MQTAPRCFAILAVSLFSLCRHASPATYYVNNEIGRDSNTGLATEPGPGGAGPFASIHAATSLLGAGDTLCLAKTGTPYRESIYFHGVRGTPADPIVIEGHGATITGLKRLPASRWTRRDDGTYLCPLKGRPYGYPFVVVNGKRQAAAKRSGEPEVELCVWDQDGIHFRPEPGRSMESYDIEATLLISGIVVTSSSYLVCRDLVSEYHSNDGFNIHGECRGMYFEDIVGRHNGDDGFSIHETVGAVVRQGHFHDNLFGVQDVNASRTVLNGVVVERNTIGFSMVGGFRSMVDCVARDNTKAQISLSRGTPKHLLGSAFNPLCECTAYLKNVLAVGGPLALHARRGSRVTAEHCVFTGAGVGVQADPESVCHLTASVVAHCSKAELISRTKSFYRDHNVYFPGRLQWLGKAYGPETWDDFRKAAGHDENSLVADPKLEEGTAKLTPDSPAHKLKPRPGLHDDSPTPPLRASASLEAESLHCENAPIVDDATASGGKSVELCRKDAAVSGQVNLKPGTYVVLMTVQAFDYGGGRLDVALGPASVSCSAKPFAWYAARQVLRVDEAGDQALKVTWRAGQVRLDRVTLAQVSDAP